MKIDTASFISSSLVAHSTELSARAKVNEVIVRIRTKKETTEAKAEITPRHYREQHILSCFYHDYQKFGGQRLPKEVVNMAVRQIKLPAVIRVKGSIQMEIFNLIAEQFKTMSITQTREVWRLSCIVTTTEFGFTVPFGAWVLHRLVR